MIIEPEMKVINCTDPEQNPAAGWKISADDAHAAEVPRKPDAIKYPSFCRPLNKADC
ncbi:MAG: hypothetical protein KHX46_00595 [Clostridiales bacterium]|nr:hypothetical protein [Clostridiales bacterium]